MYKISPITSSIYTSVVLYNLHHFFSADSVREALRDKWYRSGTPIYRIDITCTLGNDPSSILLERWEIGHKIERDMVVDDINAQLMRSYKRITVMLRTLHSFCRIVPAYQV